MKKSSIYNGASGLRIISNVALILGAFAFVLSLVLVVMEAIAWSTFGAIALSAFGVLLLWFVFHSLATIADAASLYINNKETAK